MTEQRDELTMLPEELLKFLGALLPDENGYGRRSCDDGASALNTVGKQVLDRGRPAQEYETIAATLAETSMTLEVSAWSGLDAEPTLEHAFWESRLGLVSSRSRGAGPNVLEHHAGESLHEQVFDAAGLGPRPRAQGQTLVTVKPWSCGTSSPRRRRPSALDSGAGPVIGSCGAEGRWGPDRRIRSLPAPRSGTRQRLPPRGRRV